jgi:Uma2 family endonuclease
VEILSKSTARYDLTKKFNAYQEAGVREYWVAYQRQKQVFFQINSKEPEK